MASAAETGMQTRDIVVIGASAGGIEALKQLVPQLPSDFQASVFVVVHIAPDAPSLLPQVLARAGNLRAKHPSHRERIQRGVIYVAPPGRHLLLADGHIQLTRGPRENRVRPAVDPLFRSAAVAYGTRVTGVVLSGYLDDGAAGLRAIKRCGGLAVVQHPNDAFSPAMPLNAAQAAGADFCLPVAAMGPVLTGIVGQRAPASPPVPKDIRIEAEIAASADGGVETMEEIGALSPLICTECGGPLWEVKDAEPPRFRCRLGHAFTSKSLVSEQNGAIYGAVLAAVRAMGDQIMVLEKLQKQADLRGWQRRPGSFAERIGELRQHIATLRNLLSAQSDPGAPIDPEVAEETETGTE